MNSPKTKPLRRQPEGLQENNQIRFDYHLTRVKAQVLGSCRRARTTEAPRSWLPAFQLVRDAQGYGQALRAVEALAVGLLWRGQPAERVHSDLVQLVPDAYRDVVLPIVSDCALRGAH